MLPADTQHSFRFCTTMVSVYDADGFLGIQSDLDGTEVGGLSSGADATPTTAGGGAPDYEWIAPYGILARQSDPTVDMNGNPDAANSGLSLVMMEGGRGYTMYLTDPRTTAILPPVEKGSTYIYAANGISGLMIRGASNTYSGGTGDSNNIGQVSLMTTSDGTAAGQTVGLRVWPNQFARTAPWGTESFDINGYHIKGAGGWRIDAGAIGGLPGPASALGSYVKLTGASIQLYGSAVVLGVPGPLGSYPVVVMNPALIAVFANLATTLTAIQAEIASLTSTTGPVTSPVTAAAITALGTLSSSLSAVALAGISSSAAA